MYTNFEIYSNFNHKEAHTHFADFEQVIIKISHFSDFEQVIITISHFADFEQVIIKISYFADFEQEQNSLGRNRIPRQFLGPLLSVTGTPPQLLRPVRVSTGSELYPNTGFFECLSIQFFNSPAPMLLTGRHATPVVSRCFPPPT